MSTFQKGHPPLHPAPGRRTRRPVRAATQPPRDPRDSSPVSPDCGPRPIPARAAEAPPAPAPPCAPRPPRPYLSRGVRPRPRSPSLRAGGGGSPGVRWGRSAWRARGASGAYGGPAPGPAAACADGLRERRPSGRCPRPRRPQRRGLGILLPATARGILQGSFPLWPGSRRPPWLSSRAAPGSCRRFCHQVAGLDTELRSKVGRDVGRTESEKCRGERGSEGTISPGSFLQKPLSQDGSSGDSPKPGRLNFCCISGCVSVPGPIGPSSLLAAVLIIWTGPC